MTTTKRIQTPSYIEFIAILSMMMSITALCIDAMLPALPQIGTDLGITNTNDRQLIISIIFLCQALVQLFFGPLSDKTSERGHDALGEQNAERQIRHIVHPIREFYGL